MVPKLIYNNKTNVLTKEILETDTHKLIIIMFIPITTDSF